MNSTATPVWTVDGDNGNVGIGTTSPGGKFHALESGAGSGLDIPFNFSSTKTSLSGWTFVLNSGTSTGLLMGNRSGVPIIGSIGPSNLSLQPDGGNVLIGTSTDATGKLQVNGTIYATGFFESSSINGKDIIKTNPLTNLNLDVIQYTRKTDESKDVRYGYSAEQIHSLMPELTDKDVTAVKYLDVHTLLIAQLQQEIKELKAKLN
jgi:hypothetical protein